ncbi:translation initiation factor IF-2-like [Pteropus medius]|uniref:translation initiation factor IF-2-like n=1 Tax=Pteropus vampyrus TaxID=132908 RepID=UPI00196A583F|nr:translation initiation factor IF-2-like [Pteropus giganteus]
MTAEATRSPPRLLTCAQSPPLARYPSAPKRPVGAAPPAASALPRAAASFTPRSGFRAPATKAGADARQCGERVRIWAGTGAGPRHTNTLALPSPLRLPCSPEKVRRSASRRRQGVHSPPKGSSCRAEACARARLATSHLPASPRSRSRVPQPLTWPWRGVRAGPGGGPRLGRGSSPHPQSGSQCCAPLARAALLRGASAAGGWRLSGRRVGRALSSPGRSEAAAAAAGGGFLRGRRLRTISVNSAWATVGQNSLAFCMKSVARGQDADNTEQPRNSGPKPTFAPPG